MRQNKPRCSLFTCTLTIVGALLLTTTLLSHNYATQQHHQIPRPHALRRAARPSVDVELLLTETVSQLTDEDVVEGAAFLHEQIH